MGRKQRRNPEIVEKENVHEADEKTDDNISLSSDKSLRDLALKLCPSEDTNSLLVERPKFLSFGKAT